MCKWIELMKSEVHTQRERFSSKKIKMLELNSECWVDFTGFKIILWKLESCFSDNEETKKKSFLGLKWVGKRKQPQGKMEGGQCSFPGEVTVRVHEVHFWGPPFTPAITENSRSITTLLLWKFYPATLRYSVHGEEVKRWTKSQESQGAGARENGGKADLGICKSDCEHQEEKEV